MNTKSRRFVQAIFFDGRIRHEWTKTNAIADAKYSIEVETYACSEHIVVLYCVQNVNVFIMMQLRKKINIHRRSWVLTTYTAIITAQ